MSFIERGLPDLPPFQEFSIESAACDYRSYPVWLIMEVAFTSQEQKELVMPWIKRFKEKLRELNMWVESPHPSHEDQQSKAKNAFRVFSQDKMARLVALKDKYDPENYLSLNRNIPPSKMLEKEQPKEQEPKEQGN